MSEFDCEKAMSKLLDVKIASLTKAERSQLDASDLAAIKHGLIPYEKNCIGSSSPQYLCLEGATTKSDVEACLQKK